MKDSIQSIIENKSVEILFQVILSPNKEITAGVEALSRGISLIDKSEISPVALLKAAKEENLIIELEKLLIEKAIESFSEIKNLNSDLLLFINISHEFLSFGLESNYICNCADKYNVSYEKIVFDMLPFDFMHIEIVDKFVKYHKDKGFYICIDDIGVNYNNLDRIIFINPDIIKVNRYKLNSIKNLQYKEYMPTLLKSIVNHLGILLVEKGIESEDEFIESLDSGAQFIQGFYVSKPQKLDTNIIDTTIDTFRTKVDFYQRDHKKEYETTRDVTARVVNIIKEVVSGIDLIDETELITKMYMIFQDYPFIENAWILDKNGKQVFDSFINYKSFNIKNSPIFQIYKDGSDFSSKGLYRQLMDTILDVWVTKPYNSILTNNLCIASSSFISNSEGEYIMCMNVNYEQLKQHMMK